MPFSVTGKRRSVILFLQTRVKIVGKMAQNLEVYHVDAFTSQPFRGNPACVVVLDQDVEREWKQSFAAEMNLSETAFLVPNPDGSFGLTWFTPLTEVSLCGHATLASIHVLHQLKKIEVRCLSIV